MNRILWPIIREIFASSELEADQATSNTGQPELSDHFCSPANAKFYGEIRYSDLDPYKKEIRLLKLRPDGGKKPICCELVDRVEHGKVKGQYRALSYCAGNPKQTQIVMVNGLEFNVFANLGHALDEVLLFWQTTHPDEDLLLWVDQICINQSNWEERSRQVSLMRNIYQWGEETLICLSTEEINGLGMDWLHQFCSEHDKSKRRYTEGECFNYLGKHLHDGEFRKGMFGFFEILRSPWWERAWVFQEFMSSANLQLLFGGRHIAWSNCAKTFHCLMQLLQTLLSRCDDFDHEIQSFSSLVKPRYYTSTPTINTTSRTHQLEMIAKLHATLHFENLDDHIERVSSMVSFKIFKTSETKNLRTLLQHSRNCKSSDPRDRVYAFLGCSSPEYTLVPDYSPTSTVQNVFIASARSIILQECNLLLLHDTISCTKNFALPSWVPDWTSPKPSSHFTQLWDHAYSDQKIPSLSPGRFCASFKDDPSRGTGTVLETYGRRFYTWDDESLEQSYAVHTYWLSKLNEKFSLLISHPVQSEDEVWMIDGTLSPIVLRRQCNCYLLVAEVMILQGNCKALRDILILDGDGLRSFARAVNVVSYELLTKEFAEQEEQSLIAIC